jgi:hypothetical protein
MATLKKWLIGAALLLMLGAGALVGLGLPQTLPGAGPVAVAHADGCDGAPPPPGLDCPGNPTPTPTPRGD